MIVICVPGKPLAGEKELMTTQSITVTLTCADAEHPGPLDPVTVNVVVRGGAAVTVLPDSDDKPDDAGPHE